MRAMANPWRANELAEQWDAAVRGNREQAERVRESPAGGDHYAPIADWFRADPDRTGDEALDALLQRADPADTWIDLGAGAGRFALPLARRLRQLIAIEPSQGMRQALQQELQKHEVRNIQVWNQRWPHPDPPRADVLLMSHVGYDIEPIQPFLDTVDRAAGREAIAMLFERAPGGLFHQLWEPVLGEPQVRLPGADDLAELLEARGADVRVEDVPARGWSFPDLESAERTARMRLWLDPDSPKLSTMRAALGDLLIAEDGGFRLPDEMRHLIISWQAG